MLKVTYGERDGIQEVLSMPCREALVETEDVINQEPIWSLAVLGMYPLDVERLEGLLKGGIVSMIEEGAGEDYKVVYQSAEAPRGNFVGVKSNDELKPVVAQDVISKKVRHSKPRSDGWAWDGNVQKHQI